MRRYEERTVCNKVLDKVFCNKCGKEIKLDGGIMKEDILTVDKHWGYFSGKDNEVHHFDLCEQCYDELITSFAIPIEEEV